MGHNGKEVLAQHTGNARPVKEVGIAAGVHYRLGWEAFPPTLAFRYHADHTSVFHHRGHGLNVQPELHTLVQQNFIHGQPGTW